MADNPDITAGTASVAAGTNAVTGVGTFWSTDEIRSGDLFASDGYPGARIDTVNSDTSITLKDNWRGSTLPAGSSYYIRYQPDGSRYSALLAAVRKILSLPNLTALSGLVGAAGRIPIFTGPGTMSTVDKLDLVTGVYADKKVATLAARAAYDGEAVGFSVLVANIGDGRSAIYFKNSTTMGDWSPPAYLTGPNGSFQSKGAYNNATAYVVGDVVLQNGSSWIARVNTTGNPPPALPATSNTQWFLLSAAGSGFVYKGAFVLATTYQKDDVVLYNNSTWIAVNPNTNIPPPDLPATSNFWWSLIAAKGAGDVSGAASSTDGNIAVFSGTTGKAMKEAAPNSPLLNAALPDRLKEGAVLITNLNTITASGWYRTDPGATGQPANAYAILEHRQLLGNAVQNWISVQATTPGPSTAAARFTRIYDQGAWGPWINISPNSFSNALPFVARFGQGFVIQSGYSGPNTGDTTYNYPAAMSQVFFASATIVGGGGPESMLAISVNPPGLTSIRMAPRYNTGGAQGVASQPYYWSVMGAL